MLLRGPSRPELLCDECLGDIVRATAQRRPNHPALLWEKRAVSYAELDARSEALAAELAELGAKRGAVVGLHLPRGADLLIAQAAIAKSGAAWLPLDASTPPHRVELCLKAAGAAGLIASPAWSPASPDFPVPCWTIDNLLDRSASGARRISRQAACPTDSAYVIYTSGSTGQPKGIVVTHRSICHFLRSENAMLGVRDDDIVYQGFSLAFDMSFEEIWISYLVGATLWIAPADCTTDPEAIAAAAAANRISVIHAVPTLMGLIDDPLPTVRLINLGGEACPESLVTRLARPGRRLFNTYGPTEATVSASLAELEPGRPVTIGRPLPNYGIVLLDGDGRPTANGDVGEIGLFGPGVAVGYLGQPELTADKFIANPLARCPDEARLYRTGDLGKIDASGELVYLGRADGQVKVRGFRVELGEIEGAIAAEAGVAAAAVTLRPLGGIEQLVGFIAPSQEGAPRAPAQWVAELRKSLGQRLPKYMLPAHFEFVRELPRLTSGKIDRKVLRDMPIGKGGKGDSPHLCEAPGGPFRQMGTVPFSPRSAEEGDLFAALGNLFPGQALASELDFFDDLGGHSLLVARLVSRLRDDRRYASLSIQDIYRQRRLEQIAARMKEVGLNAGPVSNLPCSLRGEERQVGNLPHARRWLCGIAQAVIIPWLMLLNIGTWLLPFFVYHFFTGDEGDSIPLAAVYSVLAFLLAELALFPAAIAGKWTVAWRLKAGRYPLWGWTYFRWWLADRLCQLPRVDLLSGTPLLSWFLRALGAKIGDDVVIDSMYVRAADLLAVDSGASIGTAVHIGNARVERGMLILGPVRVGRDAVVDSYAVLQNDTSVGDNGRLGGLSSLSAGRRVPAGEQWEGSPARRVDRPWKPLPPRPRAGRLARAARVAFFVFAGMAVAALFFMMVFPGFILIDWLDQNTLNLDENKATPLLAFAFYFFLSIPASLVLITATILLAGGLRRLLLPPLKAGVYSLHSLAYCRNWLLNRVLDSSLDVLHGVYASTFAGAWLRLMGAKVGRHAEVSTVVGIVPELLALGDDTFIADGVMLGDEEQRGGWMVLRPTAIGDRSFVGNGAYVSDGADVPCDVLIGVQTRTPDNAQMRPGQTWMGSPALRLPAREPIERFHESLTFRPRWTRKFARAAIEALRIVLPLAFVIASGYLIIQLVMPLAEDEDWFGMTNALGLAGVLYGLGSFLLVVALKWLLVGRYRPRGADVDAVRLAERGGNECLRIAGRAESAEPSSRHAAVALGLADVGGEDRPGRYLDTTDLTEFDCVSIGDGAELNGWCGPQTHLFEDRVMKIGRVEIEAGASIGESSTVLYDTRVGQRVVLGPLTLVAKGERLPPNTAWEGSPAASAETPGRMAMGQEEITARL